VQPQRPAAKIGIVFLGLVVAFAAPWAAVAIRQHFTQGPDSQASSGMYAFGDFALGVAVFGLLALVPIGLALYWLRPVVWFWSALAGAAMLFAFTGLAALTATILALESRNSWMILAHARLGITPLTALALLTCAGFAPSVRHRWLLAAAATIEGVLFACVIIHLIRGSG
jgi:hypothetical protein